MKSLADLKRAMQLGTKWDCFHNYYHKNMGVREISIVQKNGVAFKTTREDGTTCNSWFYFPKARELEFVGDDKVLIIENGVIFMTYEKIGNNE